MTQLVSVNNVGTGSGGADNFFVDSFGPVISNDGSVIVFSSEDSDLVANDSNETQDVFAFSLNSSPVIDSQALSVAENDNGTEPFGTVLATDSESAVNYAITGGAGTSLFTIDESSGELSVASGSSLDFESTKVYLLEVTVTDAQGATANAIITVNVTDVAEVVTVDAELFMAGNGHVTVLKTVGTGPNDEDQIVFL